MEAGANFGAAPGAVWVYEEGFSQVYLWATQEWLPKEEYNRRWPHHPTLKVYTDRRMVNLLEADWSDAPPPSNRAA